MKKKILVLTTVLAMTLAIVGCGKSATAEISTDTELLVEEANTVEAETVLAEEIETPSVDIGLEDGCYLVDFDTDSSMFHVNDTMNGKAVLTVKDGKAMLHLVMPSKNVLNLYKGLIADVQDNEADWINPGVETVAYDDGFSEEVYTFDVPVDVVGEEFDLALIGKKEVWYDHKVSISNPEPYSETVTAETNEASDMSEFDKTIELLLEGGTGKVTLISPTPIKEEADGYMVTIEWSSKNYDYMIVDDVKYLPVEVNEHSIFEIPVKDINEPLNVIADTVAMSEPHEIEYVITFVTDSMN